MIIRRTFQVVAPFSVLLLSFALAGCVDRGSEETIVPDVVGLSLSQASTDIMDAGFTVDTPSLQHSSTVPKDCVIDQTPEAGASATSGLPISLVVSMGPSSQDDDPGVGQSVLGFTIERNIERDELAAGLRESPVGISVEGDVAYVGQPLHIQVENRGTESAEFLNVDIDGFIEAGWGNVRNDVECPHDALCKKGFTVLAVGEKRRYTWDLLAQNGSLVDSGVYRVSLVAGPVDPHHKKGRRWVSSQPFRLTEMRP